jgi:hypothetical protein
LDCFNGLASSISARPNTSAETISTVFALDIKSSKILWKRGSKKRFGQLVLFKSWLVTTLQGKSSRLIAHRLDSGKVVAKLTLDSKPRLVLAGKNVLVVATEKGVRVFAAPRPKAPAVAWRAYEDRRAGGTQPTSLPAWRGNEPQRRPPRRNAEGHAGSRDGSASETLSYFCTGAQAHRPRGYLRRGLD